MEDNADYYISEWNGVLTKHYFDGTTETIIVTNSERVKEALVREFLNDDKAINLTENDVIEGFREFKYLFKDLTPNIFQG